MSAPSSFLFSGIVEHERLEPVKHAFRYPVRVFAFDVDDLPRLGETLVLFSHNRTNVTSLHDKDYLDGRSAPIRPRLEKMLEKRGIAPPFGRIVLVTSARHGTRVFNPVSFYYVFDPRGDLKTVVAEVNNTFGERHLYILSEPHPDPRGAFRRYHADKVFHVSPFHDMSGRYEFLFGDIRRELSIEVRLWKEDRMVFRARLEGSGEPLTNRALARSVLRDPLLPHWTMPRILWQAAQLFIRRRLQVFTKPTATHEWTLIKNPPGVLDKRFGRWFLDLFSAAEKGDLTVTLPDGTRHRFGTPGDTPHADLTVHDPGFFTRVFWAGDVGLGESFMDGMWDSTDPTAFIAFLIRNRDVLENRRSTASKLAGVLDRLRHLSRANTLFGSRRNIRRHYDLSNELFAAFLDPSMTYSCALFEKDGDDLEEAQRRKLRRIAQKARLGPNDHVLEIGCGWGSFAVLAARETGCRVTGITVSKAQWDFARQRVREAGLEDRVTILLRDYRRVQGRFDKIVSIEMLEAVGHEYLPRFFQCCERLLAPHGLLVLQTIAIPDHRYERYRKGCDWIQKYIFPGGMLPSLGALCQAMAETSTFYVESLENIGVHYARTLREWRLRFEKNREAVRRLGFDETFRRMWLYYLCFCEAAFATRTLNDLQLVLSRPNNPALDAP
ncbi:MAG: DUF1365 family protein [Desulfosoma sp.]